MEYRLQKNGDVGILFVSGDLTIQQAVDVKDALAFALSDVRHVIFNIERCTNADSSVLQLLCSAHRTAFSQSKSIALDGGTPEFFLDLVRTTGYIRNKCCSASDTNTCLWIIDK